MSDLSDDLDYNVKQIYDLSDVMVNDPNLSNYERVYKQHIATEVFIIIVRNLISRNINTRPTIISFMREKFNAICDLYQMIVETECDNPDYMYDLDIVIQQGLCESDIYDDLGSYEW